jgi:iron(III) transport system substrate-binding protein
MTRTAGEDNMTPHLDRTFIRAVALAALVALPAATASAQGWPAEKAKLVAAAEAEGEMILFSQPNRAARTFLAEEWAKAYPKIKLSISAFPGQQLEPRMKIERESGKHLWDLVFTGSTIGFDLQRDGFLDPFLDEIKDPDIKRPQIWGGWDEAFVDLEKKYVFSTNVALKSPVYDANKLSPEKVAKEGLKVLFDPALRGKIAWHEPNVPGPGAQFAFYLKRRLSEDQLRRFILDQQVVFMSQQNQVIEALARGTAWLGLGPGNSHALIAPYVKAGVNVDIRKFGPSPELNDVTIGGSTLFVVKNRPHPNATRLFLNWLLSKDVQAGFAKATEQNSRRTDVPSVADADGTPVPGAHYVSPQREENTKALDAAVAFVDQVRKDMK